MLIVIVALVQLFNAMLGLVPHGGFGPFTLQQAFAAGFRPLLWLVGIEARDLDTAARLMATKTVVNEFAAYLDFAQLQPDALSQRSKFIMTYALCGFANFGSVGIMIGGMSAMAPERRAEIVALAPRSIISGNAGHAGERRNRWDVDLGVKSNAWCSAERCGDGGIRPRAARLRAGSCGWSNTRRPPWIGSEYFPPFRQEHGRRL